MVLKDCATYAIFFPYDDDETPHRQMKGPFRLIFGLVLGLALGYGLTLFARPTARRTRRRPRPATKAHGGAERESTR